MGSTRYRFLSPGSAVDAWTSAADEVSLPRLDEVGGHPRPSTVGVTYAEREYEALADEQTQLWPAEGEHAARPFQVRASGLVPVTAATEFLLTEGKKEVQQAHEEHRHATRVLAPYVRREPWAKWRYLIGLPVLWFGDTAGVWSAAIVNGDLPSAAFGQALAAGLAAVCAGLCGTELRDIRMARARQRDPESLTEDERRYQHLFSGNSGGLGIVKLIVAVSVLVIALLAVGIGTLRAGIEGDVAGLTFGLLAAATAFASGLLGYSASDDVADMLARMAKRARRAEQRHLALAKASAPRQRAEAEEAARSIKAEYAMRGQAAHNRVESLAWRVQRRNPGVLGHGFPVGEQGGVIGRRARRGGAA